MKKLIALFALAISISAHAFDMDSCSVTFSPNGGTTAALVKYIGTAKKSVRLLAYNFTSKDVAQALVDAHVRGVDVQLVLDRSVPTEKNSVLPEIQAAGIPYRVDSTHHIAHSKEILIDIDEAGGWVATGSFNFSPNAEHFNGENSIICHATEGAKLYLDNWNLHWSHSK